jgi:hypothetical protein
MPKTPPQDKPKLAVLGPGTRTRSRKISSVGELLSRQPAARALQATVGAQQQWLDWLRAKLPAELRNHVVGAVPRRDTLIVYASSAAWSTRLRYALADVPAAECQALDSRIRALSVRVMPPGSVGAPRG